MAVDLEESLHNEVDALEEIFDQIDNLIENLTSDDLVVESVEDLRQVFKEFADLFEEDLADMTTRAFQSGAQAAIDRL